MADSFEIDIDQLDIDLDEIDLDDLEIPESASIEEVLLEKEDSGEESVQEDLFPSGVDITEEYLSQLFYKFFRSQDIHHDAFQLLISSLTDYIDQRLGSREPSEWKTIKFSTRDVAITIAENILYAEGGRGGNIASVATEIITAPEFLLSAILPRLYLIPKNKSVLEGIFNVTKELPEMDDDGEVTCPILYIDCPPEELVESPCGHFFSLEAIKMQAKTFADDKRSLLKLSCMSEDCGLPLPYTFMEQMLDEDEAIRFNRWRIMRFADVNKIFRCNALDENREECTQYIRGTVASLGALTLESREYMLSSGEAVVCCPKGHKRCPMCHLEAHCPFPCKYMKAWDTKTKEDNASIQWKYSYTKPCPKCKVDIEKNSGCMHMTCSSCNHEFCWLCKKDWRNHADTNCSQFSRDAAGATTNAEKAKYALKRFTWYETAYTDHKMAASVLIKNQAAGIKLVKAAQYLCIPLTDYDALLLSSIHSEPGKEAYAFMTNICHNRTCNRENTQIYNYADAIDNLVSKCAQSDDVKERDASYELISLIERSLEALRECRLFLSISYTFRYFMDWDNPDADSTPKEPSKPPAHRALDRSGLPTADFEGQDGASMQAFQCSLLNSNLEKLTAMIEEKQLKYCFRYLTEPVITEEQRKQRAIDAKRNDVQQCDTFPEYCEAIKVLMVKVKDQTEVLKTRLLEGQGIDLYDDEPVDTNPDGAFEAEKDD